MTVSESFIFFFPIHQRIESLPYPLLIPQAQYEALKNARATHASTEEQQRYKRRTVIEGTLSGCPSV
jgi:hypothetical protein